MPPFRKTHLAILAAALAPALFPLAPVRACGPDFPNAYLAEGSVSLLNAPEGYFASEIARLAQGGARVLLADDARPATRQAESLIAAANAARRDNELTETGVLRLKLARRGLAPARIDALASELETVRASIFARSWGVTPTFSADMPAEFALYLQGAFAYWKGDHAAAREHWTKLLALPENDRRHHTVNATYMLGRMNLGRIRLRAENDNDSCTTAPVPGNSYSRKPKDAMLESAQWLRKTREAAAAGFNDLSGLATASLGWEARAWLEAGDYAKAIHLYMRQYATGGEQNTKSAIESLRITAAAVLQTAGFDTLDETGDATTRCLRELAQDELSRRVVTVYLLARSGTLYHLGSDTENRLARQSRAWAGVLQTTGLRDVPDTDLLAWLAYQAGYFDMARDWAALAPGDSVPANWIRAKLALRSGDLAAGEALLEKVTSGSDLAGEACPVAWSELGRVRMSRENHTAALDAFLRGGHWEDAAYIAERVLTPDELRAYVDLHCPEYTHPGKENDLGASDHDSYWIRGEASSRNALRHLLARRLARSNQPAAAAKYFPEDLHDACATYFAGVREGFDTTLPAETRARAFWRAALTIREKGMELLGTELAPDFSIWGGSFETTGIAAARKGRLRLETGPAAPTAGELSRLEKNAVPEKRFHYRYRAAELGMWAASLLPNDSDETAAILNTAGGWLKNRDPKAANAFYRALVIRCPNTPLGKAAAAKNWFPD